MESFPLSTINEEIKKQKNVNNFAIYQLFYHFEVIIAH